MGGANLSEPHPPATTSPIKEHISDEGGASVGRVLPDGHAIESSGGPSFINRYMQLDQRERERKQFVAQKEKEEKEKEEEELVVSRPQKKTKKRKKKKKKEPTEEGEVTPTNEGLTDSLKDTTPTQSDMPPAEPIKLAEPVQLVKEEQVPLYNELLIAGEREIEEINNCDKHLDPFLPTITKEDDSSQLIIHGDPSVSDNDHGVPHDIVRSKADAISSSNPFDDVTDRATPTETTPIEITRTVATPTFDTEDVSEASPKTKLSIPEAAPNLSKVL